MISDKRVYQEAKEEGAKEERQRYLEEKLRSVSEWAPFNIPLEHIAKILGLDEDTVRKHLAKNGS